VNNNNDKNEKKFSSFFWSNNKFDSSQMKISNIDGDSVVKFELSYKIITLSIIMGLILLIESRKNKEG